MPLAFSDVCTCLDYLEALETAQPPLLVADKRERLKCTTEAWFKSHRNTIDKLDIAEAVALLSSLLPERRPDRVYGVQATSLCRILSRSLGLGAGQNKYLLAYKQPGRGDLAACVQRVLEKGGPPALPKVSLQDVDELLTWLASQCRFSDPALQSAAPSSSEVRDRHLGAVFKRLAARDAKWLVRLILRDLSPAVVDDRLVLKCFHFLMPDLLHFQQDMEAAVTSLRTKLHLYPSNPDYRSERLLKLNATSSLTPLINIKVSRPAFTKARSIEHCLQMLGSYSWVIERKYDGEYAEIHIDMTRSNIPEECIKIFSKNGKDATQDRKAIQQTLIQCLRLGRPECKIKQKAILLGELVAWSDLTHAVLPFEEIRKHVTRSGVAIGTAADNRPEDHEHLCIVFFDVLLLDDTMVISQSVEKRRQLLKSLYDKIPGRARSAEWKIVYFGQGEVSERRLMEQFAASNAQGCEGLVFKPCGLPYYSIERDPARHFQGYIKLKKDYIAGLGDEADFAVIGAAYDAQEAAKSKLHNLHWTTFFLGAILNKPDVARYAQRPVIKIVGSISQHHCIPPTILETVNRTCAFTATTDQAMLDFDIQQDHPSKMTIIFKIPFVFEVLGSGFVKHSDCDYYMLRHARVIKMHQDRSWTECVGFDELQQMATESRGVGAVSESQEHKKHLARLEKTMKKKFARQMLSPASRTTISPLSATAARVLQTAGQSLPSSSSRKPLAPVANNVQGSAVSNKLPTSGQSNEISSALPNEKRPASDCSSMRLSTKRVRRDSLSTANKSRMESQHVHRLARMSSADISNIRRQRSTCVNAECLLANTVIYLTPCIATTPYISRDLLASHEVVIATSWLDWVRGGSCDRGGSSPIVEESQAYTGLRRLILVEVNRRAAYQQILDHMLEVSNAAVKDVEIWDWRMLESIRDHDCSRTAAMQHMVGVVKRHRVTGLSTFEASLRSMK